MATLNYSLPRIELELQDGGLANSTLEEQNVLLVSPTNVENSTKKVLDPIVIKGKSSFGENSELGEYKVSNPLARGYKQVNDIGVSGISAIPLPGDSVIFGNETEVKEQRQVLENGQPKVDSESNPVMETVVVKDVAAVRQSKAVKAWMLLHDMFGSLKNNSSFDSIVLKNMYPSDYTLADVPVISIAYLKDALSNKTLGDGETALTARIEDNTLVFITNDNTLIDETTEQELVEYLTITNTGVLPTEGQSEENAKNNINILPYSFVTLKVATAEDGRTKTLSVDVNNTVIPEVNDDPFYGAYLSGDLIGTVAADAELKKHTFDLAEEVAGFCYMTSMTNKQLLGFMAIKPAEENDIVSIKKWVEGAPEAKYNGYLQLIATPYSSFSFGNAGYIDTIEAAYCGLVQTLNSESSTTNKSIPGIVNFEATLSTSQCSALSVKNYVTMRKRKGVYVVSDGLTTAGSDSDYTRLTTIRITNELVESVREVGDPYIGEPNTTASRNALQAQIKELLAQMQSAGKITSYLDPELVCSTQDIIDGNLKILIAFFPVFELRRINLVIALRQIS